MESHYELPKLHSKYQHHFFITNLYLDSKEFHYAVPGLLNLPSMSQTLRILWKNLAGQLDELLLYHTVLMLSEIFM